MRDRRSDNLQSAIRNLQFEIGTSTLRNPHSARPIVAMILTALLWSTSGWLIKVISMDAVSMAGWRSGIAGLTLLLIARACKIPVGLPRDGLCWLAAVFYAVILFLFVAATKVTAAANVIFLQYTAPIYVLLLEPIFLKTRFRFRDAGFVGLAVVGMSLFFLGRIEVGDWRGNAMALGSGMAFGAFALIARSQHENDRARWQAVILGNFVLFAAMLLFFLCSPARMSWPGGKLQTAGLLFLGLFQIGCAYALFTYAISKISALETMLLAMLEPILNPVWVYLGTREIPSPWAFWGGALILGAVVGRTWLEARVSKFHGNG
ncbi:MAG: DMT family transporter [Acidobacteria bacterium]|nr:DMT family transporter [Acidobacteriota bacterium]